MATSVIKSNARKVLRKTYTYTESGSIAAGSTKVLSANDFNASTPDGYSIVGGARTFISGSGTGAIVVRSTRLASGSSEFISVKNVGSSALTGFTVQVTVTYVRADFVEDIA